MCAVGGIFMLYGNGHVVYIVCVLYMECVWRMFSVFCISATRVVSGVYVW